MTVSERQQFLLTLYQDGDDDSDEEAQQHSFTGICASCGSLKDNLRIRALKIELSSAELCNDYRHPS